MMNPWQDEFRRRMRHFGGSLPPKPGALPVSIKVRVTSGCFHREDSPRAFDIIDGSLRSTVHEEIEILEHESGPEILAYLALTSSGILLAKSVVELVTAIVKARTEGVKKGDRPRDPIEVIIRRVDQVGDFREEKVLRIEHADPVNDEQIGQALDQGARKLLKDEAPKPPAAPAPEAKSSERAAPKKKRGKKKR